MNATVFVRVAAAHAALACAAPALAQMPPNQGTPPANDHQHQLRQLGITQLRPGKSGQNQTGPGFDLATANPWKDTMPELLRMKDGTPVTRAEQWPARRAEIVEDFEREVYGRVPPTAPKIAWTVVATTSGLVGGIPTVTRVLNGRADNSAHPAISVNIRASYTIPANAPGPVPVMLVFGGVAAPPPPAPNNAEATQLNQALAAAAESADPGVRAILDKYPAFTFVAVPPAAPPGRGGGAGGANWQQIALRQGWGYGAIDPGSIQADNGAGLTAGIIGLANQGRFRQPDDWGALRAWGWGVSRLIDYFEQNPAAGVDPRGVGIDGVSRYGKAALVTQAFDERVAVALVASSGEGGAKLHRHDFGEAVENLTAGGEYHWMAGNFIKYGAEAPVRRDAGDLPVDSHQLIALCAPRPVFISYGVESAGDPKWVDAPGSFMAGILAGPAYVLLGKQDYGRSQDYINEPMPAVGELVGGELAWRQHTGGHTETPNWPAFFEWVGRYIKSTPPPAAAAPAPAGEPAAPRADANSRLAHEQLLAKARQGRIDVYFLGDSITRRWGATDYPQFLAHWRETFHGWNAANFGWGGDRVENILWRVENGELDGVNPKVIVLLAGTNNVTGAGGEAAAADIAGGLQTLLALCRRKAPDATIILTAIFPRNDDPAKLAQINQINARLAAFADGKTVRFLNLNDQLADADGRLRDGMATADRLHLALKGYQTWGASLKPVLAELLGPPAQEDRAPPPTGDPSAAARATPPARTASAAP